MVREGEFRDAGFSEIAAAVLDCRTVVIMDSDRI